MHTFFPLKASSGGVLNFFRSSPFITKVSNSLGWLPPTSIRVRSELLKNLPPNTWSQTITFSLICFAASLAVILVCPYAFILKKLIKRQINNLKCFIFLCDEWLQK